MKANFHTHTTWCDGKDAPEAVVQSAIRKGFDAIGFSSHAMLPGDPLKWPVTKEKLPLYAADIKALKKKYAGQIEIYCGIEADYIHGGASDPGAGAYAGAKLDYIIGSIHFVTAPDGAIAAVDKSPDDFAEGIKLHFGGDAKAFIREYFRQQRAMALACGFDVIGHPDLCRKFNGILHAFDENDAWYAEELEKTADAFAESGKLVEVNTGAISRGWMDDAYPSAAFRKMLRERGTRFILSADSHAADTIDCAFDRFGDAEDYTTPVAAKKAKAG